MAKQSFEEGGTNSRSFHHFWLREYNISTEMLTPLDKPLDSLDDLSKSEMYVH